MICRMIKLMAAAFDRLISPGFMTVLCIALVLYAGYAILSAFGG